WAEVRGAAKVAGQPAVADSGARKRARSPWLGSPAQGFHRRIREYQDGQEFPADVVPATTSSWSASTYAWHTSEAPNCARVLRSDRWRRRACPTAGPQQPAHVPTAACR